MRTCDRCRFWHSVTQNDEYGECRRRAPVLVVDPPSTGCQTPTRAGWPETTYRDGCGEHRPHVEEPKSEAATPPRMACPGCGVVPPVDGVCPVCDGLGTIMAMHEPLPEGARCASCGNPATGRDWWGRLECDLCGVPF